MTIPEFSYPGFYSIEVLNEIDPPGEAGWVLSICLKGYNLSPYALLALAQIS